MAHKTLIIGIGGTGLTAIRENRRLIAERYKITSQHLRCPRECLGEGSEYFWELDGQKG